MIQVVWRLDLGDRCVSEPFFFRDQPPVERGFVSDGDEAKVVTVAVMGIAIAVADLDVARCLTSGEFPDEPPDRAHELAAKLNAKLTSMHGAGHHGSRAVVIDASNDAPCADIVPMVSRDRVFDVISFVSHGFSC